MHLRDLFKETAVYTALRFSSKLLSLLATVYFAGKIGASNFGVLTYMLSWVFLLQPLATLGGFQETVRKVKSKRLEILEKNLPELLGLTIFSSSVAVMIFHFLGLRNPLLLGLFYFTFNTYFYVLSALILKGKGISAGILTVMERSLFSLLLFLGPKFPEWYLVAYITSSSLGILIGTLLSGFSLRIAFDIRRIITKINIPYFLAAIAFVIAARVPQIIAKFKFGYSGLGNFGVALTVYQGIATLLQEVGGYVLLKYERLDLSQKRRAMKVMVAVSLAILAITVFILKLLYPVIQSVVGHEYALVPETLFYLFLAIPTQLLLLFSRPEIYYRSPSVYCLISWLYAAVMILASFLAWSVASLALYRTLAMYFYALLSLAVAYLYTEKFINNN